MQQRSETLNIEFTVEKNQRVFSMSCGDFCNCQSDTNRVNCIALHTNFINQNLIWSNFEKFVIFLNFIQ